MENRENVRWVIHTSCNDQNVLNRIPQLTDDELRYCLSKETRKSGKSNLLREAKKRKLLITSNPSNSEIMKRQVISETSSEPQQLYLF